MTTCVTPDCGAEATTRVFGEIDLCAACDDALAAAMSAPRCAYCVAEASRFCQDDGEWSYVCDDCHGPHEGGCHAVSDPERPQPCPECTDNYERSMLAVCPACGDCGGVPFDHPSLEPPSPGTGRAER